MMVLLLTGLFVFTWSSGFVVAKVIVPYADPTLFLFVRVCISAVIFGVVALRADVRWPSWREVPKHLLAGMLLQGLYLSATYWAVADGLPPAVMALLGSLQPLLTAVLAIPILKEIPTRRIWLGLALGVVGVFCVIQPALGAVGDASFTIGAIMTGLLAVLSITFGTILQKTSIAAVDIRVSSVLQNIGTVLFTGLFVWIRGEHRWVWSPQLWASLLWASVVLTCIGTVLLLWIIRRGQVAKAASLMFLAPPLAAVEAYVLFGDKLGLVQLAGFALALIGVATCNMRRPLRPSVD
ncbi:MAG TPA: DMT family transporter [Eoetvoesiella sp.]|uniref:DMT family transporter n=1 Tax=Eoetvoesiella sp. TaxID=1966355 RepID=UPI002C927EB3|nr:DMT family transporter [Eoetvoesiella sp.]HWK61136.1 DMT family transporter [Eoetvoesiella sp.]